MSVFLTKGKNREWKKTFTYLIYLENKKLIFAFIKGIKEEKKENKKGSYMTLFVIVHFSLK